MGQELVKSCITHGAPLSAFDEEGKFLAHLDPILVRKTDIFTDYVFEQSFLPFDTAVLAASNLADGISQEMWNARAVPLADDAPQTIILAVGLEPVFAHGFSGASLRDSTGAVIGVVSASIGARFHVDVPPPRALEGFSPQEPIEGKLPTSPSALLAGVRDKALRAALAIPAPLEPAQTQAISARAAGYPYGHPTQVGVIALPIPPHPLLLEQAP